MTDARIFVQISYQYFRICSHSCQFQIFPPVEPISYLCCIISYFQLCSLQSLSPHLRQPRTLAVIQHHPKVVCPISSIPPHPTIETIIFSVRLKTVTRLSFHRSSHDTPKFQLRVADLPLPETARYVINPNRQFARRPPK